MPRGGWRPGAGRKSGNKDKAQRARGMPTGGNDVDKFMLAEMKRFLNVLRRDFGLGADSFSFYWWFYLNIDKNEEYRKFKHQKEIVELNDHYVRCILRVQGESDPSPDLIELKRQHLIMKRTMKQFKKWRKDSESNNADVHGEQFSDETTYGREGKAESRNCGSGAT